MWPILRGLDVSHEAGGEADDALSADIAALREHVRRLGRDGHAEARVLAAYALGVALALGGLLFVYDARLSWLVRASALLLSVCGTVSMATIGHTASHGALGRSRRLNELLFYGTYPFFLMVSASYWRHGHVSVHHGSPNVVGVDPDCDLRPVFGINRAHAADIGPWRRRLQGWIILLLLPLNGFNIQRQGWTRLLSELREGRTAERWFDLGAMLLHAVVFVLLPAALVSLKLAALVYVLRVALIGVILFAVLAPGHYPSSAACLHESQRRAGHFWLRQTATTINFRTGLVGRWLCSGLEYQIEHHLFPNVNHVHLPVLSPKVRTLCERHGFPYRTLGWAEAILASWRVFFEPKVVVEHIALLRERTTTSVPSAPPEASPRATCLAAPALATSVSPQYTSTLAK
jgi:fatty acid desaturase